MTTELLEIKEVREDAPAPAASEATPEDLRAELETLVRFRQEKMPSEDITFCPACMTHVEVSANECPNCDSNIAANNALVRESLRRLAEIEARLNGEHTRFEKSSFWSRLKAVFSPPQVEAAGAAATEAAPRFLDGVKEGDALVVLERLGPWCRVKTPDKRTGWVYSAPAGD